MNTTAIYISVQRILKLLLGLSDGYIRLANQNSPKPSQTSYATISISSITPKGWKVAKLTANPPNANPAIPTDFTENIERSAIEVILMIKFYGDSSDIYAGKLPFMLESVRAKELFHTYSLGYSRCDRINIDDAMFNEIFEPFAAVELKIYAAHSESLTVNEMNKFTVSGTVDDFPITVTHP